MATDYSSRVGRVNARRNSSQSTLLGKSESFAMDGSVHDSIIENYKKKTKSKNFQYALVAMQEVDSQYTAISYREAERVAKQIDSGLLRRGKMTSVELQGSLPLNVHLRRVSDVDMLVWPLDYFAYDRFGVAASNYVESSKSIESEIIVLRSECCSVIQAAFPAARVNNSGARCITVSEGSLLREIDIVPSVLYKTNTYQVTGSDIDRGVKIYDTKSKVLITNFPFKVRHLINAKEDRTGGGCKKAIRLLKNMKEDSDSSIDLSSFNIMSLVYALDDAALIHVAYFEGKIISSLQKWFQFLAGDENYLRGMDTVDGTRKIIQGNDDVLAVSKMAEELNILVLRIAQELQPDVQTSYPAWRSKVENEFLWAI